MEKGDAPTGPDGRPVNIHHLIQTNKGGLAEVTATFHQEYGRIVHINPNSIKSGIDRDEFNAWRKQYWMNRAKEFNNGGAR